LQEVCVGNFIPNDSAVASNREGSIKIITGPNYSGKSVYLKQIGLIVYMTHIGSFVPADGAIIGLCDRIFTRIHTRETVSLAESTFMIDCHQLSLMIQHSTQRSLLLVDEFGKGTNPQDGMALMCATIEHFMLKEECPKVLITTHFIEAVEFLKRKSKNTEFLMMDFIAADEGHDDIVFLYKVVPGVSEQSYGHQCALAAGVPDEIIERASKALQHFATGITLNPISRGSLTMEYYKNITDKFLDFDCNNGDPHQLLQELFSDSTPIQTTHN